MSDAGIANTSVAVPGTDTTLELRDLSPIIAAELAAELSTPQSIRKKFGLSVGQWQALTKNPMFRGMVKENLKAFRGELAAGARILKKSEILLEDLLGDLYGIAKAKEVPSGERINAIKQLAELAGRGKKDIPDQGPRLAGFTLNINVGEGKSISIQADATEREADTSGVS